jgi:hypothetical protein
VYRIILIINYLTKMRKLCNSFQYNLDKKGKMFIVYMIFYLFLLLGQKNVIIYSFFPLFCYNQSNHKVISGLYIDKKKRYFQMYYRLLIKSIFFTNNDFNRKSINTYLNKIINQYIQTIKTSAR